jgi:hypothetical protein
VELEFFELEYWLSHNVKPRTPRREEGINSLNTEGEHFKGSCTVIKSLALLHRTSIV